MKRVDSSFFGNLDPVWGHVLTLIFLVGVPSIFYPPLRGMIDDARLASAGTVAKTSSCSVSEFQGSKSSSWHIRVSYVAQDGSDYKPDVDTFLWWRQPDHSKPCTVRYDPASPYHVSTDWGVSRLFGRVLSFLLIATLPVLLEVLALVALVTSVLDSFSRKVPAGDRFETGTRHTTDWQIGGSAASPWRGYCGHVIRTRNLRLFVMNACLLVLGSPVVLMHPYGAWVWPQFLSGPRIVSARELASPGFSPDRTGWLQIDALRWKDTGVAHTFKFRDGHTFDDGHYLLADIDGQPLLVLTQGRKPKTPFQGTLERLDARLRSQLLDAGYPMRGDVLGPYFLDGLTYDSFHDYRANGIEIAIPLMLILFIAIPGLWLSLRRSISKSRHPFARALAKRGSLAAMTQQIDLETARDDKRIEKLRVTSNWLLRESFWSVVPMRIRDVVWVHYVRDKSGGRCILRDNLGEELEAGMDSTQAAKVQKIVHEKAPQAVQHYDEALKTLWDSDIDPGKFPELARQQTP